MEHHNSITSLVCNILACPQTWVAAHGPFDVVLDGANVALFGQNKETGGFTFSQVVAVLNAALAARPQTRPLVVRKVSCPVLCCI